MSWMTDGFDVETASGGVMKGQTLIAQKSAYLASETGVEFQTVFTKKFFSGLLGGEGFILQKFSGHGEGLFLVRLMGPGKIILQSMPVANLAAKIIPFVPSKG